MYCSQHNLKPLLFDSIILPVSLSLVPSGEEKGPTAKGDIGLAGGYGASVPSLEDPLWRILLESGGSGLTEDAVDKCFGWRGFCMSMALPTKQTWSHYIVERAFTHFEQ